MPNALSRALRAALRRAFGNPDRMNPFATMCAWRADVKGSTKLVLLALAYLVRKNYVSTSATTLRELAALTGLSVRQVRNCLKTLITRKLVGVGGGTSHRRVYDFLGFYQGPLFANAASEKAENFSAFRPPQSGKLFRLFGGHTFL